MANDNWSPFYPTVFYPAQESTFLQRQMSSDLQTLVRDLSRIGQSQPQTQIVQVQSQDQDAGYQISMSIDDLRESLGRDLGGLRNELGDLSSQIEWGFESLNESITQQTNVLLTIAKQQTIPAELNASEYLANAREMVNQLRDSIMSGRLDESKNERLFEAANKRFNLAIEELPSSGLMYAILLGRAELHILVEKNDEALVILEENLIYAPKEETFDSCSYLYRLMGRIVFAQGNSLKAEGYLGEAISLSPGYAIAWYDRAQYLASTSAELATLSLRHAIEINEGFMLLASIEPNFDPIRTDVDAIQQEIRTKEEEAFRTETEKMRQECLSRCDSLELVISEVIRLSHNFWQIKKRADEIIPLIRCLSMPRSPYPTQSWDTGRLVTRGAGDFEKLSLLRTRTLTADSRDDVVTCRSEANCMDLQLSGELDILQKQWAFWKYLVSDAESSINGDKFAEIHFDPIYHTDLIAELEKKLEVHERQRPQQLTRMAQKYSDLDWTQVSQLGHTNDSEMIKHELYNHLSWKEEGQKILNEIVERKVALEQTHLSIATIKKFLEEFQQLSRAYEPDRVVFIKNCYSQLNLDLKDWNEGNGTPLQLWEFTRDLNQQWHIIPVEPYSSVVYIVSAFSGTNIDLADGNMDEGARIQMWESGNSNPNQLWRLVRQDDGSYAIQSTQSNLFLGLSEYDCEKGAIVNLQHWSGELSQRWLIHNVQ